MPQAHYIQVLLGSKSTKLSVYQLFIEHIVEHQAVEMQR